MQPRSNIVVVMLASGLVAAGCGAPDHVTYVDPNPDSAYTNMGSSTSEPFASYGAAAAYRASAVRRLRGELELASVAAASGGDVRAALEFARADGFRPVQPELVRRAPALARRIDASFTALVRDASGGDLAQLRRRAQAMIARDVPMLEQSVVARVALQDDAFRAAVLASTLMDAAADAESSIDADGAVTDADAQRRAHAAVLDARTKGVRDVPFSVRAGIADRLATLLTTSFTRGESGFRAEHVASELNGAADDVASAARIDTTLPVPDGAVPGLLRSVKQAVGAALESIERGDRAGGLGQLQAAANGALDEAASGLASVDPDLLVQVQRLLILDLPAAISRRTDTSTYATSLDARLDDAVGRVEDELEAQRAAS